MFVWEERGRANMTHKYQEILFSGRYTLGGGGGGGGGESGNKYCII